MSARDVIAQLGCADEIDRLQNQIAQWLEQSDSELRPALTWQFQGKAKYFRPLTVFACHRAVSPERVPPGLIRAALLIEMFHNMSLIIDDILDHSRYRRDKLTLHCKLGTLPALMAAGYITADGFQMARDDPFTIALLAELVKRLGAAECLQWRLRQRPLGLEDWRRIASEDTGVMFEVCACLGTRDQRLRRFGHLLGVLYHGCDDVADVRGTSALGGGGMADLRDGILTLPAALAIRNPDVATLFSQTGADKREALAQAFRAQLPEAERYLDQIAAEAREEARLFSASPEPLYALITHTRALAER
ncbi:MAG: polyprenyl synthetase family protein [Gammaproteobacteria bacterium]